MISRSIHYSLCCDECGLGYGEIGDIENVSGVLKGSDWIIVGNRHYCNYCKDKVLERMKEQNREKDIITPGTKTTHGGRTEHGWIACSERMPEKGLTWVFGRTPSGMVGVCRHSDSLSCWVDDRNEEITEGIEFWNYLPAFP